MVGTLVAKNLVRGHIGRSWMAIRDMDIAAEIIGFRPLRTKLSAFAVSSFFIGVAGALWAFLQLGSWEPLAFDINRSFQLLFMVIIGGLGSLLGSFLGAAFIVLMPILLNQLPGWLGIRLSTATAQPSRVHGLRRADRVLPDRRAARPGAAVGDRQGEAAALAVPALIALGFATQGRRYEAGPPHQGGTTMSTARRQRFWARRSPRQALTVAAPAQAQNEQFIPGLVYRTGAYAPNGIPFANGFADYYALVNERDGGINGVKIAYEECETGYATDRGVECYERLKGKGPTGAGLRQSAARTGITFALTEKAPVDKIPLISMGYGRSEIRDGSVFPWNFPLLGTYWSAADIIIQHIAKKEGGFDKLKGKKIALVYHDSPYGKEPIALLEQRAKMHGFEFTPMPVTHPGVEQKATWLQIRQNRPDYVLLWGWGVMNSTSIKEAVAVGFPRDKMFGVWWSGAEPDVRAGRGRRQGLQRRRCCSTAPASSRVHADLKKFVYDKGKGAGEVGGGRRGALQPRPDQRHAGRRGDPHGAGEVRQQAADRRAGALGHREPRPRRRRASRSSASRACCSRSRSPATTTKARAPAASSSGTAPSGRSSPTGIEADDKVLKPMVEAAAKKYADGEEDHRPRLLEGELSCDDAASPRQQGAGCCGVRAAAREDRR